MTNDFISVALPLVKIAAELESSDPLHECLLATIANLFETMELLETLHQL